MQRRLLVLSCALVAALASLSATSTAHACNDPSETFVTTVTRTFTNGASWSIGVSRRTCEGLTIGSVSYTPPGGTTRIVLHRATLAEVHVPYHTGTPRFLDVTDSTQGLGAGAVALAAAECDGTRFDGNRICVANEDGGFGWKFGTSFRTQQAIQIFMSSQLGNYNYIVMWTFHDDGTIEPSIGLTGRLQTSGSGTAYLPYGARLNPETTNPAIVGKSHMHNFYYRLDFDIDGSGNDAISRIQFNPSTVASPDGSCAIAGQCGTNTLTQLSTEQSSAFSLTGQTSWVIFDKTAVNADGRKVGYEITPKLGGVWRGMTTSGEAWSASDLWVTLYNGCERYAARNVTPQLDTGCAGAAVDLSTMANGQSVDGQDLVVWYVQRVHHYPRDEDDLNMPIEWTSFEIKPRNFHHTSTSN